MFSIDISKIDLPNGQQWLIEAMQASGYSADSKGVCFGVVHTLKDAALAGQFSTAMLRLLIIEHLQSKKYFPQIIEDLRNTRKKVIADLRKEYSIDKNNPMPPELAKQKEQAVKAAWLALPKIGEVRFYVGKKISDADWSEIILPLIEEIPAFFEKIELYQNARKYPWLLPKETISHTQNATLAAPLVLSKEIGNSNDIVQTGSFSGVYEEEDLIDFFTKFSQTFSQISENSPAHFPTILTLENCNHIIIIIYDPSQPQPLLFLDPVYLSGESIIVQPSDYETLTNSVLDGFSENGISENDITVFSTRIYARKCDEVIARKFSSQWQNQIQDLHRVSEEDEKAVAVDSRNTSWLHIAAESGDVEAVEKLLKLSSTEVNATTVDGLTALHCVTENGHTDIVWKLLEASAGINAVNKGGHTPLHLAAFNNHRKTVEELLIASETMELGLNINATDENGLTTLHYAGAKGFTEIVVELLDAGGNVNITDLNNNTTLHWAAVNNQNEIILLLLRQEDCDINAQNSDGDTPLHIAAANGNSAIVEKLLTPNCNINAQNENGDTPLHIAAANGKRAIVEKLLLQKIHINLRNKAGHTPRDLARLQGHSTIRGKLNEKVWELTTQENRFRLFSSISKSPIKRGKTPVPLSVRNNNIPTSIR